MEYLTKKVATNLTTESVSILTYQYQEIEGNEVKVEGTNHRRAYTNTESGRAQLLANEPENIVNDVLEVWGDTPTVEEPDYSDFVEPEPEVDVETKIWNSIASAIEEGINEA